VKTDSIKVFFHRSPRERDFDQSLVLNPVTRRDGAKESLHPLVNGDSNDSLLFYFNDSRKTREIPLRKIEVQGPASLDAGHLHL
jgi:hypothetical protein